MINPNIYIIEQLKQLTFVYRSIIAFFYQKINQTQYTNNTLSTYPVDYTLLLPSSNIIEMLNSSQCNAQIQEYINQCKALTAYIDANVVSATNITIEGVQNSLTKTIASLNGFTLSMLKAQASNYFSYTVEYDMGFTELLYKKGVPLDKYNQMALLNQITDFNNIPKGTLITLAK